MADGRRYTREKCLPAIAALVALAAGALPAGAQAAGPHAAAANVRPAGPAPGTMPANAPIVRIDGEVRAVHGHPARRGSRITYTDHQLITARGRTLTLDVRALPRPPRGGTLVRVVGRLHDGVLRARRVTVTGRRVRARSAAANGAYETLIVPFTLSAAPSNPWTVDAMRTSFFTGSTSVRAYLEETSREAVTLTGIARSDGDVAPWQTVTATATSCNWGAWKDAARSSVIAAGWNVSSYDRVIYVMSNQSACGWSGLAPYPSGSWSMLNGTTKFGVAAHELGHTFGLDHAASRTCTESGVRTWISATCTTSEYGDPFDAMGDAWTGRWFHTFSRQRLGWISGGHAPQVTSSGTYALVPAAGATEGARAISIPRGDGRSYHLEARATAGIFDAFSPTAAVVGGVSVRLVPTVVTADELPELLDTTPQTSTFSDAALAPGRSVTDAGREITIETLSAGATGASVRVQIGAEDPPAADPVVPPPPADPVPPATVVTDPVVGAPPTTVAPPTTADSSGPVGDPAPTSTPNSERTPAGVSVRLARRTSTTRAARSGVRLALRSGRACPCVVTVELRDGKGRVVGRTRTTMRTRSATATVRLSASARKRLNGSARAARSTTLRARIRVLSPGTPATTVTRLRLG